MTAAYRSRRPADFRSLIPARAWTLLVQHGVRAHHSTHDRLLNQGAPAGWVLLCLSGRLKVVYAEPDGRELMLAVRGPGDLVGEFSGRDGRPRSATVQAIEPGITSKVPDQRFGAVLRDFSLRDRLNSYILDKLRESATHAWQLAHRTTAARLAELVIVLIDAAGPDHPCPTTIAMSQDELASALGLVRSAITPVLAEWKASELITTSRGKLHVVDVDALVEIADADVSTSGQNRP